MDGWALNACNILLAPPALAFSQVEVRPALQKILILRVSTAGFVLGRLDDAFKTRTFNFDAFFLTGRVLFCLVINSHFI